MYNFDVFQDVLFLAHHILCKCPYQHKYSKLPLEALVELLVKHRLRIHHNLDTLDKHTIALSFQHQQCIVFY